MATGSNNSPKIVVNKLDPEDKQTLQSNILFPHPMAPNVSSVMTGSKHIPRRKHTRFQLFDPGELSPFPANLLSSLDHPFSVTSTNYQFAIKKRQQFQQYLDSTGFFKIVSKVIVKMFNDNEEIPNVNAYLHDKLSAEIKHDTMQTQLEFLKVKKEEIFPKLESLTKENNVLKGYLEKCEAEEKARLEAERKAREENESFGGEDDSSDFSRKSKHHRGAGHKHHGKHQQHKSHQRNSAGHHNHHEQQDQASTVTGTRKSLKTLEQDGGTTMEESIAASVAAAGEKELGRTKSRKSATGKSKLNVQPTTTEIADDKASSGKRSRKSKSKFLNSEAQESPDTATATAEISKDPNVPPTPTTTPAIVPSIIPESSVNVKAKVVPNTSARRNSKKKK